MTSNLTDTTPITPRSEARESTDRSRTPRRAWRNAAVWAVTPLMAAVAITGTFAPPAAADAEGCTAIGDHRAGPYSPNNLCLIVRGDGLHVDLAEVGIAAPVGGVNNIVLRITFFDTNNRQVEQHVSRLYRGTRTLQEFTIRPHKDYPTGRVCGSITENGVERPGACLGIHD